MAEWSDVLVKDLKEGDRIRVYSGDFNRMESKVERDDEDDLYAEGVGYFTNHWTDDAPGWNKHWDRVERFNKEITEPGTFIGEDDMIIRLDSNGQWWSSTSKVSGGWTYVCYRWAPLIRIYTEDEVVTMIKMTRDAVESTHEH